MFAEAGFQADDIRIWHQACNWYFADGNDYYEQFVKERIPEQSQDEALKAEMVRLFEESKTEMRTFEKIFILVRKPLDASQTND